VPAGSPAFTLNLFGSGFAPGDLVTFGAFAFFTTYISPTQLAAVVPADIVSSAQTLNVSVSGSNSLSFVVSSAAGGGLTVTCPATSPITLGTTFTETCSVFGGTAPYNWTTSALPAGLSAIIGPGGASLTISGPPATGGIQTITVTASDSTWIMHRISVPSVGSARLVPPVID
jgi:hypothetical protein